MLVLAGLFNRGGSFGDFHKNLIQAGAAATFTYNFLFPLWTGTFGIYWSLTLEEQFYLVFPVVSRLPTRLRLVLLTLPIILLAFFHRPAGSFLAFLPVDALCWGSLLAFAQRAGLLRRLEPSFLRNPLCRTASQVLSILCLVLIPSLMRHGASGHGPDSRSAVSRNRPDPELAFLVEESARGTPGRRADTGSQGRVDLTRRTD